MTFEEIMLYRAVYIRFRQSWFRRIRRQHRFVMDFHVDEDWTTTIQLIDRKKHRQMAMCDRTERWVNLRRYCAQKS